MKVLFPYLLLLLASCAWCAGPKVATVYSSWGDYAFKHELDAPLAQLGWQQEAFENTRLTELSERLAEFDFVVTSGVANYEHTVDMAPFRKQWLDWLAAGGVLLITDASYGSVLDSWLNTFGPDYALGSTQCLALTKPGPESRQVKFAEGSLLTCPKDLRAGLEQAMDRIWAHLEPLQSQGWTTLATCADGKPLMVERHVGKGLLVVTSFYRFAEGNSPALAQGLLENLQLAALAARGGLELTEFELPPLAPGPIVIKLGLRNLAEVSRTVIAQARVGGEGEYTPQERIEATLAPGESRTLELPSVAGKRGQALLRVLVTDEKDATLLQWSRPMEIPPAIVARLKRTFITLSTARSGQLELETKSRGNLQAGRTAVACRHCQWHHDPWVAFPHFSSPCPSDGASKRRAKRRPKPDGRQAHAWRTAVCPSSSRPVRRSGWMRRAACTSRAESSSPWGCTTSPGATMPKPGWPCCATVLLRASTGCMWASNLTRSKALGLSWMRPRSLA